MRQFKLSNLARAQQKEGLGSGKMGMRVHKQKITGQIPNPELHKPSATFKKTKVQKSVSSKSQFEEVRFRYGKQDLAGLSRGKLTPQKVDGQQALDYNPLAQALGDVEEGAQIGGSGEYDSKPNKELIVQPKFVARKGMIQYPNPFPPIAGPEQVMGFKSLVSINTK